MILFIKFQLQLIYLAQDMLVAVITIVIQVAMI